MLSRTSMSSWFGILTLPSRRPLARTSPGAGSSVHSRRRDVAVSPSHPPIQPVVHPRGRRFSVLKARHSPTDGTATHRKTGVTPTCAPRERPRAAMSRQYVEFQGSRPPGSVAACVLGRRTPPRRGRGSSTSPSDQPRRDALHPGRAELRDRLRWREIYPSSQVSKSQQRNKTPQAAHPFMTDRHSGLSSRCDSGMASATGCGTGVRSGFVILR